MANFFIKQIFLTGPNVETASIHLDKGLNIIYGPSNTGKSYIVECINFLFGSNVKEFRIGDDTGYNRVSMEISTEGGSIFLERQFDDNKIIVSSSNPDIPSGKYSTGKAKQSINNLWLQLMGIENPPQILKNESFGRQALTARSFLHTFLIEEDNVFQKESIIFRKSVFSKTAILSILLYFITGDAFEDFDPREEKKVKEAKKNAVIKYINNHLASLATRRNELIDPNSLSVYEVREKIDAILNEISNTEEKLSIAINRSKDLSNEIYNVNSQLAESNMLHNRYEVLRSQYNADISRLTFIVEGEVHKNGIQEVSRCPFCNGGLEKEEEESCIEAAGAELQKIVSQLKDLDEAEHDIINEIDNLYTKRSHLEIERSEIEAVINSELKPKINELQHSLNEYRSSIENQNETNVLERFEKEMLYDLRQFEDEEESEIKYKPKEHFNQQIMHQIDEILTNILEKCNFDHFSSAYFSKDSFDVVINGQGKFTFGKGYRAFLNTVVALSFMEYLAQYGAFSTGLLVIDSPILSLKEKGSEQASDSMKLSLFKYLLENQNNGQIIIIENEIPQLDYSEANLIQFTKDVNIGRYGLLYGVTE
ncbi:AAA family ATPase [Aquibacillus salsiterrae]|uniref:AAA family ATPase n=1 Tax=Aquibacillus salsiterrae TaxID=2950439 RepID=A0A9X3WGH7_9BACI|nr:AAA family ATPase [Aquibacillus salsiterrae]MDC3416596.1 AAA family ATPase [Aquibacillus salsiterrae]